MYSRIIGLILCIAALLNSACKKAPGIDPAIPVSNPMQQNLAARFEGSWEWTDQASEGITGATLTTTFRWHIKRIDNQSLSVDAEISRRGSAIDPLTQLQYNPDFSGSGQFAVFKLTNEDWFEGPATASIRLIPVKVGTYLRPWEFSDIIRAELVGNVYLKITSLENFPGQSPWTFTKK